MSFAISGLKTSLRPKEDFKFLDGHEIAEVEGRPARCFFTWDAVVEISDVHAACAEGGVRVVGSKKRIVRTEPLTGHEAFAWRRAQRVTE